VVERPAYNVTVFKAHYGKMTLKIYSKEERVLRIEVIVHNTKAYRWGRSLTCFPEIVNRFKGILERFVDALNCINVCFISDQTLERLPEPAQIGPDQSRRIDLNKPRMRRAAEAVLALSASPTGFTASDLARQAQSSSGQQEAEYGARRAAYDIKKFRAKGMVRKIAKSRRYEVLPEGLRSLNALLILREKIIRPLLAASGQAHPPPQGNPTPLDRHYENLRAAMRGLFAEIGNRRLSEQQFIFHPVREASRLCSRISGTEHQRGSASDRQACDAVCLKHSL
jgi:hypothetical protein